MPDAHRVDTNVQRLWRPELRRLPGLAQDLDHLHTGANWRHELPVLAAAAAYAERLRQPLASHPPAPEPPALRLLPHAYLRYLGDLHGGQMLARTVRQRFALAAPQENAGPPQVFLTPSGGLATEGRQVWGRSQGTAFYAFDEDLQQTEQLKRDFRAGLNALVLTPLQADAFVAEACEGFRLHG